MRRALALTVSLAIVALAAAPQPAVSQAPWAGWAQCQINVTGPGYTDQQTHTWTITGSTPTVQGAFRVYPGTWSVVGGGVLQKTQGTQTLVAQWATNSPSMSAPIAVFVRASDQRMFVQLRHAQLRAPASIQGYQQQIIDGTAQKPGAIAAEAFEWTFPQAAVSRPSPNASLIAAGSSTPVVNGKVGLMQPDGSQATASCTWQFSQGAAPAPPPTVATQAVPTPGPTGAATTQPPPAPTGGLTGGATGVIGGGIAGTTVSIPACLAAPGNLTASVGAPGALTLQWSAPAGGGATSYVFQWGSAPGKADIAIFGSGFGTQTSLALQSVDAGSYYIRVLALNGCNGALSLASNEVLAVVR